ncbi:MAG TPA: hypothetical protein VFU65_14360 [Actinocrinis sp.]|nr:hypothetical protein [Actinocrinis sp.]
MTWAFWLVDCGAWLVEPLLPLSVVVLCDVPPDDDDEDDDEVEDEVELAELCVDPGSATARATAPATPETPTTEVMAFTRARSRRLVRFGWSNIAAYSVR